MRNTKTMIIGILGGIVTGAALGVLFAPDKGKSTRKKLMRKGEDIAEKTSDAYHDLTNGISKKLTSIKREVASHF